MRIQCSAFIVLADAEMQLRRDTCAIQLELNLRQDPICVDRRPLARDDCFNLDGSIVNMSATRLGIGHDTRNRGDTCGAQSAPMFTRFQINRMIGFASKADQD
jgi:hypothetical protein